MKKTCTKCKNELDLESFFNDKTRKSGKHPWCKKCIYLAERESKKIWEKNNKERCKRVRKKWRENNKERHLELQRNGQKRWEEKYPEKRRAYSLTQKYREKIKKDHCEDCGSDEYLHMHHEDYKKPLEVITLCRNCHVKVHRSYA